MELFADYLLNRRNIVRRSEEKHVRYSAPIQPEKRSHHQSITRSAAAPNA
jgi:hypothetical protein